MKSKQPQPSRTRETRGGKLHLTRSSDGKVYCVVCNRYKDIATGNCCNNCLEQLGSPPTQVQFPLSTEGVPGSFLHAIRVSGMIQGRKACI